MGNSREYSLYGKKVVLLGGTSGLGLATAMAAAKESASVTVVSSSRQKVDKALAVLPENSAGFVADLGNENHLSNPLSPVGYLVTPPLLFLLVTK